MNSTRWVRRGVVGCTMVGAATLLIGGTYEQMARRRSVANFPAPGKLVDVGKGRRLQLDCRGSGLPTVVLESGLDAYGSLAWAAVHDSIARTSRVCAYSRAGIMWSDPPSGPFDVRNAARDLHAALIASGEAAPWVMVGHSIGGPYAMIFTQLFAAEVTGIVFVDASHPEQFIEYAKSVGTSLLPSATIPRIGSALAWTGLVRLLPVPPNPASWPHIIGAVSPAFLSTSLSALTSELEAIPVTLEQAGMMRSLGERPIIVLTAMRPDSPADLAQMGLTSVQGAKRLAAWRALHDDEATWSARGQNVLVEDASHYIQFFRPDLVISAVRNVVTATRSSAVVR